MQPSYQSGFYAPGRGVAKHPELWDGCVGAWNPGLGNTGLSLRDWSGNQNNGTLTNGPTWAASQGRQALTFDGVNDYVDVPHNTMLNAATGVSLTVCYWLYYALSGDGLDTDYDGHVGKTSAKSLTGWVANLRWTGPSSVQLRLWLSGLVPVSYSSSKNYIGAWTHVVMVIDRSNNTGHIYEDGSKKTSGTISSSSFGTTGVLRIGNDAFGSFTKGSIDDVRIYNRALSSQEVHTLAQRPGIAYERAPRKFYSLPAAASSRQYRLFRPAILRGA
jgi:hypothetical protein